MLNKVLTGANLSKNNYALPDANNIDKLNNTNDKGNKVNDLNAEDNYDNNKATTRDKPSVRCNPSGQTAQHANN
eukprot:11561109-Ditylum_brightwellii.AAC.1